MKEAQAKSDLHQVPSSPTQLCVSAEIGVPCKDHETLIIELQPAAASLISCIMLAAVQRAPVTFLGEHAQGDVLPQSSYVTQMYDCIMHESQCQYGHGPYMPLSQGHTLQFEGNTPADRYLHNMPPADNHWLTSWQGLLIHKHHQSAMIICYVYLLV